MVLLVILACNDVIPLLHNIKYPYRYLASIQLEICRASSLRMRQTPKRSKFGLQSQFQVILQKAAPCPSLSISLSLKLAEKIAKKNLHCTRKREAQTDINSQFQARASEMGKD